MAVVERAEVEQVLDHSCEVLGVALDPMKSPPHRIVVGVLEAFAGERGLERDRGERIPEVVGEQIDLIELRPGPDIGSTASRETRLRVARPVLGRRIPIFVLHVFFGAHGHIHAARINALNKWGTLLN
ncbi:MAG TPA: hypothetical protein VGL61_00530 [Kofleriaceae bacterium]